MTMTRIDFIKCIAALPLVSCESPQLDYGKAVRFEMSISKLSLKERLALLKEAGFDGVEMNSGSYKIEEVSNAARSESMKIVSIENTGQWSSPLNHRGVTVRNAAVDSLKRAVEEALKLEAEFVSTVPGVRLPDEDGGSFERAVSSLNKVLPMLNGTDLKLVLQNSCSGFSDNAEVMAKLINALENSSTGVCLDLTSASKDKSDWIELLGPKILTVHNQKFTDSGNLNCNWKILDGYGGDADLLKDMAG